MKQANWQIPCQGIGSADKLETNRQQDRSRPIALSRATAAILLGHDRPGERKN